MIVSGNFSLDPKSYILAEGIDIVSDNIVFDGNGATIIGSGNSESGIKLNGRKNVTIKNLNVFEFKHGLSIKNSQHINLIDIKARSSRETPPNTIFMNIFHNEGSYPGAAYISKSSDVSVRKCDFAHQMCGLLSYHSKRLRVSSTNANYCSGFGFYLSSTTDSVFEKNFADFCCRWHERENNTGHMGADSAGFVITNNSNRNTFDKNFARMGGDGFFLSGLQHDGTFAPCNYNEFTNNDASWSPNISFEATFSEGNIFRNNIAQHSNYGFWLGFSRNNILDSNHINFNRQAGIAVENGIEMQVISNQFTANGYGILLWSKRIPQFDAAVPDNTTSRDWQITQNNFLSNRKAIRIAADQDHGIRPFLDNGLCPTPYNHHLAKNRFSKNTQDVEIEGFELN